MHGHDDPRDPLRSCVVDRTRYPAIPRTPLAVVVSPAVCEVERRRDEDEASQRRSRREVEVILLGVVPGRGRASAEVGRLDDRKSVGKTARIGGIRASAIGDDVVDEALAMVHAIFMGSGDDWKRQRRAARTQVRFHELAPPRFAVARTVDQVAEGQEEGGAGRSDLTEDRRGMSPGSVIAGSRERERRRLSPCRSRDTRRRQEHEETATDDENEDAPRTCSSHARLPELWTASSVRSAPGRRSETHWAISVSMAESSPGRGLFSRLARRVAILNRSAAS